MMRRAVLGAVVAMGLALPVGAETLADIKQDLAILSVELKRLQRELSTTQGAGTVVGGTQLDRITTIEGELRRLTGKTEELEFRILQVTKDGTARIRDLEFRICEMEEGCDLSQVGQESLGGLLETSQAPDVTPQPQQPAEAQLAVREKADFKAAQDALEAGKLSEAAGLFATFRDTYPSGPLEVQALIGEGLALDGQGDTKEAARRYLGAYSGFPKDPDAPEALWRLGVSLGKLGSRDEACVTLTEVSDRYPDSPFVAKANESAQELGCK
ncbi:MAG: tetratricopeptide repeat protein [Pelagimonas sp.]|jgi:tol-pal system protein YbgF|nr:tetratricopeptide repeat protein [Pelagimonas sp.]